MLPVNSFPYELFKFVIHVVVVKIYHIWKRNAGIGVFSEDSSSNMRFLGMRIILANLCDWNTMMNYVVTFSNRQSISEELAAGISMLKI
jgi:hypothetical protein